MRRICGCLSRVLLTNRWREIIDGGTSISHTLIVSITRCDEDELPQTSLFSAGSMSIPINKLTEDGVVKYINTCLNGRVASSGQAIASFLYSETQGSPLFLRTLMTTLLKEQVVSFDYDALQWRFDLGTLQSHLSDANFDLYLESAMRRLPSDVQDVLKVSTCVFSTLTASDAFLPAEWWLSNRLLGCFIEQTDGRSGELAAVSCGVRCRFHTTRCGSLFARSPTTGSTKPCFPCELKHSAPAGV